MTLDDVLQLRDAITRSLRADSRPIVATLVPRRDGHSYREPGEMMVMTETLEQVGGVSGGCLEGYIARTARPLLADRPSLLMSFDTAADEPAKPRLGCGGRLEIMVELGREDHVQYLGALADAMRTTDHAAAVIQFSTRGAEPSPELCRSVVVGDRITFGPDLPADAIDHARSAVELRECLTLRSPSLSRTASYIWPQPRLVILGAQDDAKPLVAVAKTASWHVTVIDARARLATPDRFPTADRVLAGPWDRTIAAVDFTPWTAAVVMTHSVEDDLDLLPALTAAAPGYLGLLGPGTRSEKLRDVLTPLVRTPVGLPLGDKSPAGIAISIMAELVAWRRGKPISATYTPAGTLRRDG